MIFVFAYFSSFMAVFIKLSIMEKTPKTPWNCKRPCSEKMDRMCEAKCARSSGSTVSSPAATCSETMAPEDVSEPSNSNSSPLQGTSEQHESLVSLDDSLRIPMMIDDCSGSESNENFSNNDAQVVYKKWLKEKSKKDKNDGCDVHGLLDGKFNMISHGAANEVGLVFHYNEKTVRTWRKDYYANKCQFSESNQRKHARSFILDYEGLQHKAAGWVRENSTVKGKPNMTGSKFFVDKRTSSL